MGQPLDGAISPTPHYYEIQGRAAEIARALGSATAGAEHLFLAMLHDGGWPVETVAHLVDPAAAEAAVLSLIRGPAYVPPPPPRFPRAQAAMQPWGAELALEMGDGHLGLEHAFLAIVRQRQTVPARALVGLADLDALATAVIDALNAPAAGPPAGAVFLPEGQVMDAPLRRAIVSALPAGTTFGFSGPSDERTWAHVIGSGGAGETARSRAVLNAALASLDRPVLDG